MDTQTPKTTLIYRILTAVFVVSILLPSLIAVTGISKPDVSKENKPPVPIPVFKLGTALAWPNQFEDWYRDNFGGRMFMVSAYEKLMLDVFKANYIFNVTIGKNDELFSTTYVKEYYKPNLFKDEELKRVAESLDKKYNDFKAKGTAFALVIAPGKPSVMFDILPEPIKALAKKSNVTLLQEYMKANGYQCPVVYMGDTLLNYGKKDSAYYKYDTHWNYYGAYLGFNYMLNRLRTQINIPALTEQDFEFVHTSYLSGDLGRSINRYSQIKDYFRDAVDRNLPTAVPNIVPVTPIPADFHFPAKMYYVQSAQTDTTLPKILVFRDSFSKFFEPFYNKRFQSSTMVWNYKIDQKLYEQIKPQVVLLTVVDFNLKVALLEGGNNLK